MAKVMNRTIEESIFDILIFAGLRNTGYHAKNLKMTLFSVDLIKVSHKVPPPINLLIF